MNIPVDHFERAFKYIDETCNILNLSIGYLSGESKSIDAKNKLFELGEIDKETMERWKSISEFAKEQVKKDFQLLYAHALVAIWGYLESMVIDFLVLLIEKNPELMENDIFKKIKIPLSEYELLDKEDRIFFLIRESERSLRSDFKPGVERFEALFNLLQIGGSVEEGVKKSLYELYYIRNLIIHRSSIVDQKFLRACPWIKKKRGDILILSADDFENYRGAVVNYINSIIERLIAIKSKKKNN